VSAKADLKKTTRAASDNSSREVQGNKVCFSDPGKMGGEGPEREFEENMRQADLE